MRWKSQAEHVNTLDGVQMIETLHFVENVFDVADFGGVHGLYEELFECILVMTELILADVNVKIENVKKCALEQIQLL